MRPWTAFTAAAASAAGALGVTATKYVFARGLFSQGVVGASEREGMLREIYGEYTTFVAIAIVAVVIAGSAFFVSQRTARTRVAALATLVATLLPLGLAASKPYTLHDRTMHEMFAAADVEHAEGFTALDAQCMNLDAAVEAAGGIVAAREYQPHVDAMAHRCIATWLDALERGGTDVERLELRIDTYNRLHPSQSLVTPYDFIEQSSLVVDDRQRVDISNRALAAPRPPTRLD